MHPRVLLTNTLSLLTEEHAKYRRARRLKDMLQPLTLDTLNPGNLPEHVKEIHTVFTQLFELITPLFTAYLDQPDKQIEYQLALILAFCHALQQIYNIRILAYPPTAIKPRTVVSSLFEKFKSEAAEQAKKPSKSWPLKDGLEKLQKILSMFNPPLHSTHEIALQLGSINLYIENFLSELEQNRNVKGIAFALKQRIDVYNASSIQPPAEAKLAFVTSNAEEKKKDAEKTPTILKSITSALQQKIKDYSAPSIQPLAETKHPLTTSNAEEKKKDAVEPPTVLRGYEITANTLEPNSCKTLRDELQHHKTMLEQLHSELEKQNVKAKEPLTLPDKIKQTLDELDRVLDGCIEKLDQLPVEQSIEQLGYMPKFILTRLSNSITLTDLEEIDQSAKQLLNWLTDFDRNIVDKIERLITKLEREEDAKAQDTQLTSSDEAKLASESHASPPSPPLPVRYSDLAFSSPRSRPKYSELDWADRVPPKPSSPAASRADASEQPAVPVPQEKIDEVQPTQTTVATPIVSPAPAAASTRGKSFADRLRSACSFLGALCRTFKDKMAKLFRCLTACCRSTDVTQIDKGDASLAQEDAAVQQHRSRQQGNRKPQTARRVKGSNVDMKHIGGTCSHTRLSEQERMAILLSKLEENKKLAIEAERRRLEREDSIVDAPPSPLTSDDYLLPGINPM